MVVLRQIETHGEVLYIQPSRQQRGEGLADIVRNFTDVTMTSAG